jgi:translation initiation factor IF-1
MEKVFLVSGENFPKGVPAGKVLSNNLLTESNAVVEKVLGRERYLVSLADGTKLTAVGPGYINRGSKVRIASLPEVTFQKVAEVDLKPAEQMGGQWSALIPIKLGDKTPGAHLEVYVGKEINSFFSKRDSVVYLVFSVKTETYGVIQWSVYLKGKHILAQIYAEKADAGKKDISEIIQDFELSLKKKGFSLLAPTVILKKPFKVPNGFQLNVRG